MNIVYDHQIFALWQYGGVSRYFFEISRNINKNINSSTKVAIVAPVYINKHLSKKELLIKGKRVGFGNKAGKILFTANRLIAPRIISKLKPDIVHKTYYYDHSRFLKSKTKNVITIHDMTNEIFPHYSKNSKNHTRNKKKAAREADHIFCVSENTKNDLMRIFNVNSEKITVIYHGVFPNKNLFLEKKSSFKKPFLLFVGNRCTYRNFRNLLFVYASNPDLNQYFNLVAFGGGKFTKEEKTLIKELNLSLENVIHKTGNDNDLFNLYKKASMLVYPSLYEGFGLPPLEAMKYGCPVACSHTSSIPEVVGDAALLFDPLSLKSISDCILKIIYDKKVAKDLTSKGLERAKKFKWDKAAKKTLNTYKKLI